MSDEIIEDGALPPAATSGEADIHGQTAMLLVESLIHGLIERSIISVADAINIVDIAMEVKLETGADLGDTPAALQKSITLLQTISSSLKADLPGK